MSGRHDGGVTLRIHEMTEDQANSPESVADYLRHLLHGVVAWRESRRRGEVARAGDLHLAQLRMLVQHICIKLGILDRHFDDGQARAVEAKWGSFEMQSIRGVGYSPDAVSVLPVYAASELAKPRAVATLRRAIKGGDAVILGLLGDLVKEVNLL